ncbi:MAG: FAD-dependent oxidoreductase [Deltaproteobacteria bacterium]|nr:FAD-dependent oxidoreductase [Deltaproteobacteria bacterium]
MGRRGLLGAAVAGWLGDVLAPASGPVRGRIVGGSCQAGHGLRRSFPAPSGPPERADVVIVGAGVAGASAAWRLAPTGLGVLLLELEPRLGGTSAWGEDGVVPYPWGAHYLPAPNPECRAALRLLAEIGTVTAWDAAGWPIFDERRLCHAPQERLFYRGAWHPGLVPDDALCGPERADMARFQAIEDELTQRRGADGRPAFQLPVERSSRDPELLALDRLSIAQWLDREGLRTPFVRWYVRLAVRDDFGGELDNTSAWAALHYFAARKLRTPQLSGSRYLVWPEGNGRLVQAMLARAGAERRAGAMVTAVEPRAKGGVEVRYLDRARREMRRIEARAAVVATPAFVARRLVQGTAAPLLPRRFAAPWLVANLHLRERPDAEPCWDSLLYDGEGLGYVDAGHQRFVPGGPTVLTYFRAYGASDVAASRAALLGASWAELASEALGDLTPAHPDLGEKVERLDVMVHGHAMPQPRPGFLGAEPFSPQPPIDRHVAWAHVDRTGMALFEEANLHGVRAAESIADALGAARGESWL